MSHRWRLRRAFVSLSLCTLGFAAATPVAARAVPVPNPGNPGPFASPPFSRALFTNPGADLRPKYRWWQPEADTTDSGLAAQVQQMSSSGGGGYEQNGFPVTMNSSGQTTQYQDYANSQQFNSVFGWGTPAWSDRAQAAETAAAQDGVIGDMNEGSRWNDTVPSVFSQNQPAAAQQLVFGDVQLQPGATPVGELPPIQSVSSGGGFGGSSFLGEPSGVSTELCRSAVAGQHRLDLTSIAGLLPGDTVTLGEGADSETAEIKRIGTASACAPLSQPASAGQSVVHVPEVSGEPTGDSGGTSDVGSTSAAYSSLTGVDGTAMAGAQYTTGEKITIGTGSQRETDTITNVGTFDMTPPTSLAASASVGATNVELTSTAGFLKGDTITLGQGSDQQSRTITSVGQSGTGTTLSQPSSAGDLGIRVSNTSGLAAGNHIVIDPGQADQETVTIASVNSAAAPADNVLLQDATLSHAHTSGEPVIIAGTGVSFTPALTNAYMAGSTAIDTGTGLTLAHPLTKDHPEGATLAGVGSGVTLAAPLTKSHAAGANSAVQTTVAATTATGATSIQVASTAGLRVGDTITIGSTGFTEEDTITSINAPAQGAATLTLSSALTRPHFDNDPVVDASDRSIGTTSLDVPSTAGATTINVASVDGLEPGDTLVIGDPGALDEIATIKIVGTAGVDGTGVTLTSALGFAHGAGERVSDVPAANASAGVSDIAQKHLVAVEFAQCASSDAASCPSDPTGGTRDLDPATVQVVTSQVSNGKLHYTSNGGVLPQGNGNPWEEIVLYQTADGQTLNGATARTPAYWLSHISIAGARAVATYFDRHILNDPATMAAIHYEDQHTGKPAVFEDSLEDSSNIKWSDHMITRWKQWLGYDPTALLPAIVGENVSQTDTPLFDFTQNDGHGASLGWRVREDYRQMWSDLYTRRYQATLDKWATAHGLITRFQSYGDPIDEGAAGAHEGIAEGEHLEFGAGAQGNTDETQQFKVVASGTYQTGNSIVSDECCEQFGTTFGSTFGVDGTGNGAPGSPIFSNANSAYADIAGGDTQIVFHGWPYNPYPAGAAAVWPGNSYGGDNLVSSAYGPNNPNYSNYDSENTAFARIAAAMRQGQPTFDVAVYHQDLGLANQGADQGPSTGEDLGNRVDNGVTYTPTTGQLIQSSSSLAQTGFTYGYVSPAFFRFNSARYGRNDISRANAGSGRDRVLFPGHGNYSSLMLYNQSVLPVNAADKILALAKQGLPVLIVGQVPDATASADPGTVSGLAKQDALVQSAMTRLTALPNVKVVPDATAPGSQTADANAPAALRALGIDPSTGLSPTSTSGTAQPVVTVRRYDPSTKTNYYYLFNPDTSATVYPTVTLAGSGQPYVLNAWSGAITPIANWSQRHGYVRFSSRLAPGNFELVAVSPTGVGGATAPAVHATSSTANATHAGIDNVVYANGKIEARARKTGRYVTKLSNGRSVSTSIRVPRLVGAPGPRRLTTWQLSVDSWGPTASGDPLATQHTRIPASGTLTIRPLPGTTNGSLPSWVDITPQHGFPIDDNLTNVAGIGTYSSTFRIPAGWTSHADGALLNIGVAVDTVSIFINNTPVTGIDQNDRNAIDVRPYLRAGLNTIQIQVATPLQNAVDVAPAVPATGQVPNSSERLGDLQGGGGGNPFGGGATNDTNMGLMGPVTLTPYGQAVVATHTNARTTSASPSTH